MDLGKNHTRNTRITLKHCVVEGGDVHHILIFAGGGRVLREVRGEDDPELLKGGELLITKIYTVLECLIKVGGEGDYIAGLVSGEGRVKVGLPDEPAEPLITKGLSHATAYIIQEFKALNLLLRGR